METRSIFSVNTNLTFKPTQTHTPQQNPIHSMLPKLLPGLHKQLPYLCKLFYLQLLLRQNMLVYSEDRIDARDIWLCLSRALDLKKPEIYVVDETFNMQEVLATKNQYGRVLLYDVAKLKVDAINRLLNAEVGVCLVGIEGAGEVGVHVADLFPIHVQYHPQSSAMCLVENFHVQGQIESARNFDKKYFNEIVKNNFQIVVQQAEDEGFLKPFLSILQFHLDKLQVKVSQARWKKMLIVLKFVGVNKQEGVYKRMCLGDFVLAPELLASSLSQLETIRVAVQEAIKEFVPFYGIQKFQKSTKNHYWFSKSQQEMCKKLVQGLGKNVISFLYPCLKFPQTASICSTPTPHYRILGYQKKLMSDHHIEVDPTKKHILKLQIRSQCKMVVHLGIACYDKFKNIIMPVQACRRSGTQVVYRGIDGDMLEVGGAGLHMWKGVEQGQGFAYERAIGVYYSGDTSQVPPLTQIIYNQKDPYSLTNHPYMQISLPSQTPSQSSGFIKLSTQSRQWLGNNRHMLHKNKTVLMNHYEGGVGCIGQTLILEPNQWKNIHIQYEGELFENTGRNFFNGTRFVRVVVMVNYTDGFPTFQIYSKNGVFLFKDIIFGPI